MLLLRKIGLTVLVALSATAKSEQLSASHISLLRYSTGSRSERVVFGIPDTTKTNMFMLDKPKRLVIDFDGGKLGSLTQPPASHPFFLKVRGALRPNGGVRIVLDLKSAVLPVRTEQQTEVVIDVFDRAVAAKPLPTHPHWLQRFATFKFETPLVALDLQNMSHRLGMASSRSPEQRVAQAVKPKPPTLPNHALQTADKKPLPAHNESNNSESTLATALPVPPIVLNTADSDDMLAQMLGDHKPMLRKPIKNNGTTIALNASSQSPPAAAPLEHRDASPKQPDAKKDGYLVIAIDAGHGGKDMGAQGIYGTQEKDVVFAIAQRLADLINRQIGMMAVMVRQGDEFIRLKERRRIAKAAQADLLVSIHADAFANPQAQGTSVYALSNDGASSKDAFQLANRENAVDSLSSGADKTDFQDGVQMDLSNNPAHKTSLAVGEQILKQIQNVNRLHSTAVQEAGFVVLKSFDMPSLLIETAYISNPEEEWKLRTAHFQDNMALAIFKGINAHFKPQQPIDTLLAATVFPHPKPHNTPTDKSRIWQVSSFSVLEWTDRQGDWLYLK